MNENELNIEYVQALGDFKRVKFYIDKFHFVAGDEYFIRNPNFKQKDVDLFIYNNGNLIWIARLPLELIKEVK